MSERLADLPQITTARVLELKAEAVELKVRERIKQTAALARIAHREGFASWERLVAKAGGAASVIEAKRDLPPSESRARRNEIRAERIRRFGGAQ